MHEHCPHVVGTSDDDAVALDVVGELHESTPEAGRRRVTVGVVPLHIGDDGNLRVQAQEHVIVFVGFEHELGGAAGRGIAIDRHFGADDVAAVDTGPAQHLDDHGRGRRLAMGAGHGNQPAIGQQHGQELAALDDRQPQFLRRLALGVGGVDGAADQHDVGQFVCGQVDQVVTRLAGHDARALARQGGQCGSRLAIAAADLNPHFQQHVGDRTQTGAANTDQVDAQRLITGDEAIPPTSPDYLVVLVALAVPRS